VHQSQTRELNQSSLIYQRRVHTRSSHSFARYRGKKYSPFTKSFPVRLLLLDYWRRSRIWGNDHRVDPWLPRQSRVLHCRRVCLCTPRLTCLPLTCVQLSFAFILIGSVLCQVLYTALRDAMNAANFDIINIHTSLGTQMFAFVWTSCVTSGLALILWSADCCIGYRRQRRY